MFNDMSQDYLINTINFQVDYYSLTLTFEYSEKLNPNRVCNKHTTVSRSFLQNWLLHLGPQVGQYSLSLRNIRVSTAPFSVRRIFFPASACDRSLIMTVAYIPRSRQTALTTIMQFSMEIYLVQGRTRRWKTAVAVIAAFNLTGLAVDPIRFYST